MENFGAILSMIGSVSTTASCLLAFYVYFNINRIKNKIEKQAQKYKNEHNQIKDELKRCLSEYLNEEAELKSRSKLRQELYYIKRSYPNSLKKEMKKINAVIASLSDENINREFLCDKIDEIIALFMGNEL